MFPFGTWTWHSGMRLQSADDETLNGGRVPRGQRLGRRVDRKTGESVANDALTLHAAFAHRFSRRVHQNDEGRNAFLCIRFSHPPVYCCGHVDETTGQRCDVATACAACARLAAAQSDGAHCYQPAMNDDGVAFVCSPHEGACGVCLALSQKGLAGARTPQSLQDAYMWCGRKLLQQYVTHSQARIQLNQLNQLRVEDLQKQLRRDTYKHVQEAIAANLTGRDIGKPNVLPASVKGSKRAMHKLFLDAMALMRAKGAPTLFFTMACSPADEAILASILWALRQHEDGDTSTSATDAFDIVSRVFAEIVKDLIRAIYEYHAYGECAGYTYSIEFQKRRLPHIHLLIILKHPPTTPQAYDEYVTAELPDDLPELEELRKLVADRELHACDDRCLNKNAQCSKHFPFKYCSHTRQLDDTARPLLRRRSPFDGGATIKKRVQGGTELRTFTNADVVPHTPKALKRYRSHQCADIVTGWRGIKYVRRSARCPLRDRRLLDCGAVPPIVCRCSSTPSRGTIVPSPR